MSFIYLNGDYVEDTAHLISHRDCGFTTGIGIFDSMLVKDKKPMHIQDHFDRIMHDSKIVIGLPPFCTVEKFKVICDELLEKNNIKNQYARVRTTVTGGLVKAPLLPAHTPTLVIDVAAAANPKDIKPARCVIIQDFPRIAGCKLENCKRLDYSRSYAARRQAEAFGGDEAIITNTEGNIACAATSNVFIEEKGKLITPPLSDGVLAGVTRKNLIEERSITEENISVERLKSADNIFITNSFVGLRKAVLTPK